MINTRSLPSTLFRLLQLDSAVLSNLITRIWTSGSGLITAILVVSILSPDVQGYYYTFYNLINLQVFIELGLSVVVISFSSHEWIHLHIDEKGAIFGNTSALARLSTIVRFAFAWFAAGAFLFLVILLIGGQFIFNQEDGEKVFWFLPWISMCVLASVQLILLPTWSVLEGCGQVSTVYRLRLVESILVNLVLWVSLVYGGGLWAIALSMLSRALFTIFFVLKFYPKFFMSLWEMMPSNEINWRTHLWPMQWRLAVSSISGYFISFLFVPVLFYYQGAEMAGKMGITWSLMSVVTAVISAWTVTRAHTFSRLVAESRRLELDNLFMRILLVSSVVSVILTAVLSLLVYMLAAYDSPISDRILPPTATVVFLMATCVLSISAPFGVYLRAHKVELFVYVGIFSALFMGISVWFSGKFYTVTTMAIAYLAMSICATASVICIWMTFRKKQILRDGMAQELESTKWVS